MSAPIIRVEQLGKRYRIRHQTKRVGYRRLSEELWDAAKAPFRRVAAGGTAIAYARSRQATTEDFWALKDVSFDVQPGEVVGIIGRNGAGKSTLLKILSRITEPSAGRVRLRGRLASLLEVGTGFHPELTGRENIYLNGAIVGMTRAEIKRKFDEIVAFAEVDKFLDTPVKRYSSGMYVRLAFAVAAHLEPEILVVDEVLAVGDAAFQKKCLGKMQDVAEGGRTVLFVSHNMAAVRRICRIGILLQQGRLVDYGDVDTVVHRYHAASTVAAPSQWQNTRGEFDNPWFRPQSIAITDRDGKPVQMPAGNDSELWFQIDAEIDRLNPALTVGYAIYAEDGTLLYWSYQTDKAEAEWPRLTKGSCLLRGRIPSRLLNEGAYRLELIGGLDFREWLFMPGENAPYITLTIEGGLSDSPIWRTRRPGLLAPALSWVTQPLAIERRSISV